MHENRICVAFQCFYVLLCVFVSLDPVRIVHDINTHTFLYAFYVFLCILVIFHAFFMCFYRFQQSGRTLRRGPWNPYVSENDQKGWFFTLFRHFKRSWQINGTFLSVPLRTDRSCHGLWWSSPRSRMLLECENH